ncbi:MAG: sigma-54-dependent Fis family transcriptional regulator [Myxococcales bacterium]|nr:sigma-54-dependent Fis family transcriptional regulator [Myxococcales bacterium]
MSDETTEVAPAEARGALRDPGERLALVVLWSAEEPGHVGEVLLVPPRGAPVELGRGTPGLVRQRPGQNRAAAPLESRRISRRQLRVQGLGGRLQVENLGRCALLVRGVATTQAVVEPGELLEIEGQLLLLCARRPAVLPAARGQAAEGAWGVADADGVVGESPAAWALRDQLGFIGPRAGHVLVLGRSGTGKELAARALHRASPRAAGPFVARNAATIPESLMDAELFGHTRNYPNAGMPERPGLVGEADGGTLFLDEIGELPVALQAHLLRLMDGGEYQRLGEARTRRADLRLVAATNRPRDSLKSDVLARFRHVIELPDLDARREDVPLLIRHLLGRAAAEDAEVAGFLEGGYPRLAPDLVAALVLHPLPLQVRELDALLWRCLAVSRGDTVERAPDLAVPAVAEEALVDPGDVTEEALRAALAECEGVQEKAWRILGLNSRYQLRRLLRKYGIQG